MKTVSREESEGGEGIFRRKLIARHPDFCLNPNESAVGPKNDGHEPVPTIKSPHETRLAAN